MSDTIFIIEDRGLPYIGHWFLLMIAGLKDLYKIKSGPVNIHIQGVKYSDLAGYQQETIDLLQTYFTYINDPSPFQTKIQHHGTPLIHPDLIPETYNTFLKRLLDEALPYDYSNQPTRLVYISRNGGVARRHIMNEQPVYEILKSYGFEYVLLEKLSLCEKIQLFREAKIIVSPNGAGLVMAHWCHPSTHVIEIHDRRTDCEDHHFNTCRILGIQFSRYTNVNTVDEHGNPMSPYLTGPYNYVLKDLEDFKTFIHNAVN